MNPGRAQVLTCPHCGGKKEVISLISGNTFGRIVWSDRRVYTPMLPEPSFVQKCPHCGKYFLTSRQETHEFASTISFDKGELPYAELKEAWKQLSQEDLTQEERTHILVMQVWDFNEEYDRHEAMSISDVVKKEIPAEEHEYLVSIVRLLQNTCAIDNLFKAELLREIGEFDEALKHLDSFETDIDFWKNVKEKTREKIEAHDTLPFIILGGV